MAALVTRDRFNIAADVSLGHYTFEKNPLGCVAALAMLEFLETFDILRKVREDEVFLRARFEEWKRIYPVIGDIRGLGLLWGIELVEDGAAERIMYACLERGLSFKVSQGRVLQLSPPLTITLEELTKALSVLENVL